MFFSILVYSTETFQTENLAIFWQINISKKHVKIYNIVKRGCIVNDFMLYLYKTA